MPQFLPPKTALHRTLVLIVLDWTKPWSFLDQLKTWLTWVEVWAQKDTSRETQVLREEGHERCEIFVFFEINRRSIAHCFTVQSHLQHYVEPAGSSAHVEPVTTITSSINSTLLPLGSGTLTHNVAGLPIVVVCTKADLIDEEEDVGLGTVKGKGGEWEERTDAVMQVLRTICLKCECILSCPPFLSLTIVLPW